MARKIHFQPSEYRELNDAQRDLLTEGYRRAIDAVMRNVTPRGFSACSLADNEVYGTDVNYRSVWARDGSMTVCWTLDLDDPAVRACQRQTLVTLMSHQARSGQIPANVRIESDEPDYSGVGGIASIDSGLWVIVAMRQYAAKTGDASLVNEYREPLRRAMEWLSAHDSNNDGLLEIPEAGDWTDLFARSYHVLYDEVLWYRCLMSYAEILRDAGDAPGYEEHLQRARSVRRTINANFWPRTEGEASAGQSRFTMAQAALGDARYLLAQLTPFGFSWRCDVLANLMAFLMYDLLSPNQAMMTFRFLWGVGANDPAPVRNLYPPVYASDPEWRDYFTVNLLNLPNHYHNGGIWPFVGGMWVRYVHKLGLRDIALQELVKLAALCKQGQAREWEFNEWHHGVTGRPMGKAYQAWSAASFIQACHDLQMDAGLTGDAA